MKLCTCTVALVPERAPTTKDRISEANQSLAAPIPLIGSVWFERVCLVPNETSLDMIAWMRSGSTWETMSLNSEEGAWGTKMLPGPIGQASVVRHCASSERGIGGGSWAIA